MKNVNPRKVFDIQAKMSALTQQKFQSNDLCFFQRLEEFIEQESLSDQRFGVSKKYELIIPENHVVVNNNKSYQSFLEKWNPEEKGGMIIDNPTNFSGDDFEGCEKLCPGKKYEVTEYVIRTHNVPFSDCLEFFNNEKAGLYGLQVILALLELNKDEIAFAGNGVASPNKLTFLIKNSLFMAERIGGELRLFYAKKGYFTKGVILLTLKEKS